MQLTYTMNKDLLTFPDLSLQSKAKKAHFKAKSEVKIKHRISLMILWDLFISFLFIVLRGIPISNVQFVANYIFALGIAVGFLFLMYKKVKF